MSIHHIPDELIKFQDDGLLGPTDIWIVWKSTDDSYKYFNDLIKTEDWFCLTENIYFFGDDGCGSTHGWSLDEGEYVRWNVTDSDYTFERHKSFDLLVQSITAEFNQ